MLNGDEQGMTEDSGEREAELSDILKRANCLEKGAGDKYRELNKRNIAKVVLPSSKNQKKQKK